MSAKSFYFECKKSEESDDRSSISSIPWNSDAIKQNQITWECIERMLHHEEALPEEEIELRQEILDWQQKFPQLAKTKTKSDWLFKQNTFNTSSTNISETNELSSSPENDSIEDDDHAFQTEFLSSPKAKIFSNTKRSMATNRNEDARLELADVFGKDLHITPLTLRQRKSARLLEQRNFSTTSSISDSPVSAKATRYKNLSKNVLDTQIERANAQRDATANSRFHMPPILNVLESKRRFCALNGNRSFVQLTQIQAKSAAVNSTGRQPPLEGQFKQVWTKPLAAVSVNSRFLNNRNSIILPALRQQHMLSTTNSSNPSAGGVGSSRRLNSFPTSNSSLSSADIHGRQRIHCLSNSQTTTSTSGRSISAVPIHMHGSFYHL